MTILEVAIASSLMAIVLLAGTQLAGSVLSSTSSAVRESSQLAAVSRAADDVVEALAPVGASSLWGTPVDGKVDEFMADKIAYERITFRTPVGYENGEVVYDPPADQEADALWYEPDGGGVDDVKTWGEGWGSLMLLKDGRKTVLRRPVHDVQFLKADAVLIVNFVTLRDDEKSKVSVNRTIHLQAR